MPRVRSRTKGTHWCSWGWRTTVEFLKIWTPQLHQHQQTTPLCDFKKKGRADVGFPPVKQCICRMAILFYFNFFTIGRVHSREPHNMTPTPHPRSVFPTNVLHSPSPSSFSSTLNLINVTFRIHSINTQTHHPRNTSLSLSLTQSINQSINQSLLRFYQKQSEQRKQISMATYTFPFFLSLLLLLQLFSLLTFAAGN